MHVPPLWLVLPFLPAYLWPITLPLLLGLIWLAVRSRGRRRRFALAGVAVLVVPPVAAFVALGVLISQGEASRRAEYARTHTVAEAGTTLDGIAIPAGAEITWTDGSRSRWSSVSSREPIEFLGLRLREIGNGGRDWSVALAEPRRIGDWPCAAGPGRVTLEGELISCNLVEAVTWQGWTLPARSRVTLRRAERQLDVSLLHPASGVIEGRESGRSLRDPATLNDDGSPASARFRRDDPLRVGGVPLWGDVSWRYDPATFGEGQSRPAVTVAGWSFAPEQSEEDAERAEAMTEEQVVVTVATGMVTPRFPRRR